VPKGASSASSSQGSGLAQDFEDTLVDYFGHMGNERQLQFQPSSLRHYDYSAVRVALVTSVPGYHSRTRFPPPPQSISLANARFVSRRALQEQR
jgi:hypothetical protein